MASTPHGQLFASNRPVVMGRRGMVSSGHPLASQAGVSTLQRGGNAVDAALAVAAAVSVVEPLMSGIGGDGFIMVYTSADDSLQVINATGSAPYEATLERYQATGIPMKGVLSTSVPSLLRGWTAAHARYGTLPLSDVLAPAIDLAANGFPVSHLLARNIAEDPVLTVFPTSAAVYARQGRPIRAGEMLYQEDLARTFERIAAEGEGVFYEGDVAEDDGAVHPGAGRPHLDARPRRPARPVVGRHLDHLPRPRRLRGAAQLQRPRAAAGVEPRRAFRPAEPRLQHRRERARHGRGQAPRLRRPRGLHGRPGVGGGARPRPALEGVRCGAGQAHRPVARRAERLGRRSVALPGLAAAEGCRERLRAPGGHHLLLRRRPVGQRRVDAAEPADGLRLQHHRGQYGRAAQQPHDLLAPGPQPH